MAASWSDSADTSSTDRRRLLATSRRGTATPGPRPTARYDRDGETGHWTLATPVEDSWPLRFGELALELKLTEFGHLGMFPEQADNWDWIAEQLQMHDRPLRVLNLFAYTGAATLAAAAAGAEVTHVDAAANVVAWARRNAELSDLIAAPIRWIADDALKFARRELKRGRRYEGRDPRPARLTATARTAKSGNSRSTLTSCSIRVSSWRAEFPHSCWSPAIRRNGPIRRRL